MLSSAGEPQRGQGSSCVRWQWYDVLSRFKAKDRCELARPQFKRLAFFVEVFVTVINPLHISGGRI